MYKFAHMSDCHLGSQQHPVLRELELRAFQMAIKDALKAGVDFIIIAGDLFHSNLPNMEVVKRVTGELRRVRDAGVPIYVNYGSHDYSPSHTSMVDILESAGVIEKVVRPVPGKKLGLEFTVDERTGAKITGLSGRSRTLEEDYYRMLDRGALESEEGFKVFLFHSAITQFKPADLADMDSIDLNLFPRGFDYYAGGHVHRRGEFHEDGYGWIVFPGTLFGSYARDLEENAKGEKRGYYLIEFSERVEKVDFREIKPADFTYISYDVSGESSRDAMKSITAKIRSTDVSGSVAMVKIWGELTSGKTSDIDSAEMKRLLEDMGAIAVNINRHGIRMAEKIKTRVSERDIPLIEERIFRENLALFDTANRELKLPKGLRMAHELLKILRNSRPEGEKRAEYDNRILMDGVSVLGLNEKMWSEKR